LPINAPAEKLVFVTCNFPPLEFVKNGQITGSQVETVLELCNRLGFECKIRVLPWKRALRYVENGKADAIFAARHSRERAKFLYYLSEPVGFERNIILAHKESDIKVTGPDDLKGKIVGVVRGYEYGPKFSRCEGMKKIVCNSDKQLIKMLAAKRFPLAAGADEVTIRYLCRQMGVEIRVVYVLNETPGYIAFSRKAAGQKVKSLADKFDKMLRQLKEEGVIRKIESKYF